MKSLLTIWLSFFCLMLNAQAPKEPFTLVKSIPVVAVDIAIDNLDNLYILTPTEQLKKLNANGDSVAVYNDVKRFGKLHSIDVSNPLKVLVYYKNFSTIVILDRLLSLRSVIDLRKQNIIQASAVALSYDNNIWIFDALENKLRKIDEFGNNLSETTDLRNILSTPIQPSKIIDHSGLVYLYDPLNGLFAFDYYGAFKRKYPVTGFDDIAISDKFILGTDKKNLQFFNTTNQIQQQYQFPSSFGGFQRYLVANSKLHAIGKDSITVYSFVY